MLPRLPRRQQNLILIGLFVLAVWYIRARGQPSIRISYLQQAPKVHLQSSTKKTKNAIPRNTVVVAATKGTDTSWVEDDLPDWNAAVYLVDDKSAPLHTDENKGNEANVYLKYIIDNYDSLSDVTVFIHGHRETHHVDLAFSSNPNSIRRLKIDAVKQDGYQSLSCWHQPRCDIDRESWWNAVGRNNDIKDAWPFLFSEPMPDIISAPIYAQFAVSRDAVRARPLADYRRLHEWLLEPRQESYRGGWVLEHLWHYIFGKEPLFCQLRPDCLCRAFDLCDAGRPEVRTALHAYDSLDDPDLERQLRKYKGSIYGYAAKMFKDKQQAKELKEET